MADLRDKVHLDQSELPASRHDLTAPLVAGVDCSTYRNAIGGDYNPHGDYDVNRDFFAPNTGLFRALDVAAPEYQGGQDFIGAWNPSLRVPDAGSGLLAEPLAALPSRRRQLGRLQARRRVA